MVTRATENGKKSAGFAEHPLKQAAIVTLHSVGSPGR